MKQGIRLLKVWKDNEIERAIVYIPNGKESYFLNKVKEYGSSDLTKRRNPKNNDLIRTIEDVRIAILESFWVGDKKSIPEIVPCICELWLRYDEKDTYGSKDQVEHSIRGICESNNIYIGKQKIEFPERLVFLIRANRIQLENILETCDYIAEIRKSPEANSFFIGLSKKDQSEWIDDLLSRTKYVDTNVSICILDGGINEYHPLIAPFISEHDIHTVNETWGTQDDYAHGTEMAGLTLYYDLNRNLESGDPITIDHSTESVKILPKSNDNPPELYGALTRQAVSIAEINNPIRRRVMCMAVTSDTTDLNDGRPTSWSAAIDSITSGAEENGEKRLFFISAGNIETYQMNEIVYPQTNEVNSVDDPGQSWNAVTVGGFSKDVLVDDDLKGFYSVASLYGLSPYSKTSLMWNYKWPIKPEILLDAGNVASNGSDYSSSDNLSILTTCSDIKSGCFTTINGTSPATAQASWIAAKIMAVYPDIWPETVRALIIHSAEWSEDMQCKFNTDNKKKSGRRYLLRMCGYGIPDLERAIHCYNNSVSMVIQGELQPFINTGGKGHMKDMDLHEIPWPKEVLISLGEINAKLKVTLSYFIEPGPGEIGWKDKYRYPSCGLRFDVINSNESIDDFKKRVNVKMRGDDKKDKGEGTSGSERWYLGSDNRDVGSIHSDFIETSAVNLSNINYIAVYPVIGWWRERTHLGKCNSKIRYSLIVSISTPERNADLYTPIINQINTKIKTEVMI